MRVSVSKVRSINFVYYHLRTYIFISLYYKLISLFNYSYISYIIIP